MNTTRLIPLAFCLLVSGCSTMKIDGAISAHDAIADQVRLGDTRENALAILMPTQNGLPNDAVKRPDHYIKDGVQVDIYYMRSGRQPDGLTTDDEFTPYVFNNSILVGIGWACIGGPRTQGQAASKTNVNVQQKTIIH